MATAVVLYSVLFLLEAQSITGISNQLITDWEIDAATKSSQTELLRDDLDAVTHMTDDHQMSVSGAGVSDVTVSDREGRTESPAPIVSSCVAFLMDFSEGAAAFTRCSILYARPFRLCENCIDEYQRAVHSYHAIMKGTFHDKSGVLCSDLILNSDRIQIVVQTFKFVERLWSDCHCDSCFHYEPGSTLYEISNDTQTFLELSNKTQNCFNNYTHGEGVLPFTNTTIDPALCSSCSEDYRKLNVFYEDLLIRYPDNVCMDIVDMMNSTRLCWSKEFHCSLHNVDVMPVILLSIFFCSLPVIFYVSNKIHGTKTEKKFLKQKRMRESQINCCAEEDVVS